LCLHNSSPECTVYNQQKFSFQYKDCNILVCTGSFQQIPYRSSLLLDIWLQLVMDYLFQLDNSNQHYKDLWVLINQFRHSNILLCIEYNLIPQKAYLMHQKYLLGT